MAPPGREVLEKLVDFGDSLFQYLSSVNQLLNLLDKLENLLSTLDQAPDGTVKDALLPLMKALISNELFRHSDEDVKISVTSCIAEIIRITAPEAPYDDEQMKEIFKLTVAAFEKLSHVSGRCYEKALLILDNVASVRSFLVMMDLECDDLIIEMFQQFLGVIRSNHPHTVIFAMETIMTMVLNESEEISSDLLRPLLDSVRKENQTISRTSWTLGEKVITNCADKLQHYLMRAVKSTGRALDDYAQIVVSVCQRGSESLQHDLSNGSRNPLVQADENKLAVCKDVHKKSCDVTKGLETDMTCAKDVAQIMDEAKSNKRNASASTMDAEIIKKKGSKRQPHSGLTKNDKRNREKPNFKSGNLESVWEPKAKAELDTMPKKRGRKPNSLMNPEEGYDHSWIYMGRKSAKSVQSRKAHDNGCDFPPSESPASRKYKLLSKPENVGELSQPKTEKTTETAKLIKACDSGIELSPSDNPPSRKDKLLLKPENMSEGCEPLVSLPKTDENTDAARPLTNHSIPNTSHPKRGRPKKNIITNNHEIDPNSASMLKEDRLKPPSLKLEKDFEVMKNAAKTDRKTAMAPNLIVGEMNSMSTCEDEEKPKSVMNIEAANIEEGKSLTQTDVKKKRRLDATSNIDLNKSSIIKLITESTTKTLNGVEETLQTRQRKRGTAVSVEASEARDWNGPLVGSRIKVWWPMDKKFYEGVVDSYDSVKGKHKILYADGDVEVLNLKKQRWELITDHVSPDGEQGIDLQQLEVASDTAEKRKGNSESESAKGTHVNSLLRRDRASARISKSIPAKSAGKSLDNSALMAAESMADPPRTDDGQV